MTVPAEPMAPCLATQTIAGKTWTCRIPRHAGPDNHYFTRDEPDPTPTYRIDGELFKIEPTSCRCGGSFAWLKQRPSGAWEMVGCICHHAATYDPYDRDIE